MLRSVFRFSRGFAKTAPSYLLIVLLAVFTGCSTVSTMKEATVDVAKTAANFTVERIPYVGGPKVRFQRKAAVVPFENDTMFKQFPLNRTFQDMIVQKLSKSCSHLVLLLPGSPEFPSTMSSIPRKDNGDIDNMALVENGKQFGLNAAIVGGVLNLSLTQKEEGILWFRETKEKLMIQFSVQVFDTETGAKIFDDRFVHEIKGLEPEEVQAFKDGKPALFEIISDEIDELADKMAKKTCNSVISLPWTGYVVSVVEGKVYLSFGAAIGAKTGDILDVYESGETVENFYKQKFVRPGKKIGQIELVQVDENLSVGKVVSGENVKAGSTVKLPQ